MYAPKQQDTLLVDPAEVFSLLASQSALLIDVRSETEFARGSIPGSLNIPILEDPERVLVGTCYKERGAKSAVELGHQLVFGEKKQKRVKEWIAAASGHLPAFVSCARGGMRSSFAQQWLLESGFPIRRVREGYKGLRNEALDVLDSFPKKIPFVVIAGRAGSGKTKLFRDSQFRGSTIDLEDFAKHSGSSFGSLYGEQPSQASFENRLAHASQGILLGESPVLFLEDESRSIGRLNLPAEWFERMSAAPRVLVETSLEERIQNILSDYVDRFLDTCPKDRVDPLLCLEQYLISALEKISRRLGGLLAKQGISLIRDAVVEQRQTGSVRGHEVWIKLLLTEYYDPCYDYDLKRKWEQIRYRGSLTQVRDLLASELAFPNSSEDVHSMSNGNSLTMKS